MAYLTKRISRLIDHLKSGRLQAPADVREQLDAEVAKVRFHDGVTPDLATCSPSLRAFARAYAAATSATAAPGIPDHDSPTEVSPAQAEQLNVELFEHFEEVFSSFTGETPERLVRRGLSFDQAVHELGTRMQSDAKLAVKRTNAAQVAMQRLSAHYQASKNVRFTAAHQTAGMKFVIGGGGSSNFYHSALSASRSMLLYCDTLLIPDPVLPWMEVPRDEERAPTVRMLKSLFHLLQLAPIVRAGIGHPPVVVFPSWERLLEKEDERTQDLQEAQMLRFFSHYLDARLEDLTEVLDFATARQDEFLSAVQRHQLFVAQGGSATDGLSEGITRQRREWARSRSEEFNEQYLQAMPDALVVALAIVDRLGGQFHVSDNAESLRASPLFSMPAQWHYFLLLQQAQAGRTVGEFKKVLTAAGVTQPALKWLGNVPIAELVELRRRSENEKFRQRLSECVGALGEVGEDDSPRVSAEVERAISALLTDHQNEVRRITEEQAQKHGATAVMGWMTFAASFATFSPYLPVFVTAPAALGILGKYASEKVAEKMKLKQQRRTLLGCLAAAHDSD